jgi:hypothetical protein
MIFLILSANYVANELLNEFGKITPSDVPVGNKLLLEHQISIIKKNNPDSTIFVSKPTKNNFNFSQLNVTTIEIDPNLNLIDSFFLTIKKLNELTNLDSGFQVMFGDGHYSEIINSTNSFVTISESKYNYEWGHLYDTDLINLKHSTNKLLNFQIFTGYFQINNFRILEECLKVSRDIINCLELYLEQDSNTELINYDFWLDFGHLNSYFSSKKIFSTERYFNEVIIKGEFLTKKSYLSNKIINEYHWFKNLPENLKIFTPRVNNLKTQNSYASYDIEYKPLPTLSELFTFGNIPIWKWKHIFDNSFNLLNKFKEHHPTSLDKKQVLSSLYITKTKKRLEQIKSPKKTDIVHFCDLALSKIKEEDIILGVMHGDFCFSNLLWDSRSEKIILIDPRGAIDSENLIPQIYGDIVYDLAKFLHSSFGFYDFIVSDRIFSIKDFYFLEKKYEELNNYIFSRIENEFGINRVSLISRLIILFSTMIPLHGDKPLRQEKFIINIKRLKEKIL